ncbi:hypothetical protein FOZ63_011179, partial [Perkinsus olseni]
KHHSVSRDASSLSSISEDEIVECDQQQQPPLWRSEVTRRVSAPLGQLSPRTTLLSQRQVAMAPSHHLPSQVASGAYSQAILPLMAGPPLPPQRSPREGHKVGLDGPSLASFPATVTAADLAKFPPPLQQQLPAAHPATRTAAGHPPAALMPFYWPANRDFFF